MSAARGLEEEAEDGRRTAPYILIEPIVSSDHDPVSTETKLIFLLFGGCAGFFWEELLNCLPTIIAHFYIGERDLAGSVTTAFNCAVLFAAVPLIIYDPLKRSLVLIGSGLLFAAPILVAIICQYALRQTSWGLSALVIVSVVAGLASGLTESSTFAYALCLNPRQLAGYFSMGFGGSGVLSYFYWSFTTAVTYDTSTFIGSVGAVWSQQLLAALIAFASMLAILRLRHTREYRDWEHRRAQENEHFDSPLSSVRTVDELEYDLPRNSTSASTATGLSRPLLLDSPQPSLKSSADLRCVSSPSRSCNTPKEKADTKGFSVFEVLWQSAACQWHLCLILWITYAIMPNLVPLGLHMSPHVKDRLTGFFQICDFAGRYLASKPAFYISKRWSCHLSHARLLVLGAAVLSAKFPDFLLSQSIVAQSVLITLAALSNGWLLTLFFMHLSESLDSDRKKGCATSISVMSQLLGVVGGLWFVDILNDGISI